MLFGCIFVPDFHVQAAMHRPADVPIAILDGPESLPRVFACNSAACALGIATGMTKLQAEVCPGIVLQKRSIPQEVSAQAALLDCGYRGSPCVESTAPGMVIADLTGAARLLGPPQKTARLLRQSAKDQGLDVNVGISSNPDGAACAARGFPGITVIAPGEEASSLARLPLHILDMSEEVLDTLESWGIRNCGALAALPPLPLTERLGQAGLHLQRLARGEGLRELLPAEPPPHFEEYLELEEPVDLLEPLAFVLNQLLEQLMSRLMARSLATDLLRLNFDLEVHRDRQKTDDQPPQTETLFQQTLKLPAPTQDAKLLLKLLQLDLAAHPPTAPIRKITIEAEPARVRSAQAGIFQPVAPEPAKLEVTLARLRAVVGEKDNQDRSRVGFAVLLDSYRPDSFHVWSSSAQVPEPQLQSGTPRLFLRLFRPQLRARMEVNGGVPAILLLHHAKLRVVNAAGPWRSYGEWWEPQKMWQRDEWDLLLRIDGGIAMYRVSHDLKSGEWFVEGTYD